MFGKHLVDRGLIRALDQQQSMRPSIGRLAFQEGFLTLDQVVVIIDAQARSPLKFCALAVELGLVTLEQRDSLLARQQQARLPLGQVLASMDFIPADVLEEELNAYFESRDAKGDT